jgi:hypothetical protein
MRVLCVKIINPATLEEVLEHHAVRMHDEHVVLSILITPERGADFQIIDAHGGPSWWDARMFMSVDASVPPNWTIRVREGGLVELAPSPWLEDGFWERYFDGDVRAITVFEDEKARILEMTE